jgi:hypothetical protein
MKNLFTLFLFLTILSPIQAEPVTPSRMENAFNNWAHCSRLFRDFDIETTKQKKLGVFIYKKDKDQLEKTLESLLSYAREQFGKEDASRMMTLGIVTVGFREWKDNLTNKDVRRMVDECRELIYQY